MVHRVKSISERATSQIFRWWWRLPRRSLAVHYPEPHSSHYLGTVENILEQLPLAGEHMAPGCTVGRRQAGRDSVMLWAAFCWENLDTCNLPKHSRVCLLRRVHLTPVVALYHRGVIACELKWFCNCIPVVAENFGWQTFLVFSGHTGFHPLYRHLTFIRVTDWLTRDVRNSKFTQNRWMRVSQPLIRYSKWTLHDRLCSSFVLHTIKRDPWFVYIDLFWRYLLPLGIHCKYR